MNTNRFVPLVPSEELQNAMIVCVSVSGDEERMRDEKYRWMLTMTLAIPGMILMMYTTMNEWSSGNYPTSLCWLVPTLGCMLIAGWAWRDTQMNVRSNGQAYPKHSVRADPRFSELMNFYVESGRWAIDVRYELNPMLERLAHGAVSPTDMPEVQRKLEAGRAKETELRVLLAHIELLARVAPLGSLPVDPSRLLTR